MLLNKRYLPPPKTQAACQHCQDLDLRDPSIRGILGIPVHILRRSAERGCPFCSLLAGALGLQGIEPPDGEPLFGVTLFSNGAAEDGYSPEASTPLTLRLQTEYVRFAEVEMFVEEGCPCVAPAIGPARSIAWDAGSEGCMRLIQSWILECSTTHVECTSPPDALLPDRVLDVRSGKPPSLHINGGNDRGVYAALSHCWGGSVSLILTDDNVDQLRKGMELDTFPRTFRDAVEVCRSLNITYLWIDSLCIVQTSKADWDVQGSKMAGVYSRCFLTIAADGARDSKQGFLRGPGRRVETIRISSPLAPEGSSVSTVVYARMKGTGNRDVFNHHSWEAGPRSPLSMRGWVLQESVLAPRLLHFTSEEVTWECKAVSCCECQVQSHRLGYEPPLRQHLQPRPSHGTDWLKLVQEFSCRDLTYSSDRLPAISGLASWLQPPGTDITYCAGLWSDSLPQSLFWLCIPHSRDLPAAPKSSKRVQPPCAPTWSWASITGRVVIPTTAEAERYPANYNMRDIQVSCPPAGANSYGAVTGGTLTANAYVLHGRIASGPDARGRAGQEIHIEHHSQNQSNAIVSSGGIFLDVVGGDDVELYEGDKVALISQNEHDDPGAAVTYLLLKPPASGQGSSGSYQRLGCYMTDCPGLLASSFGRRQTITIT